MIKEPHKPIIDSDVYSTLIFSLATKQYNVKELERELGKSYSIIHLQIRYLKYKNWISSTSLKNKNFKGVVNYPKLVDEFIIYCRKDIMLSDTLTASEKERDLIKSIIKYSLQRCAELGYHKRKGFTISHLFNILKIKMFIDDDLREVTPRF
jgi:predicted transcriptional regulator